jgi:hypothetical protein
MLVRLPLICMMLYMLQWRRTHNPLFEEEDGDTDLDRSGNSHWRKYHVGFSILLEFALAFWEAKDFLSNKNTIATSTSSKEMNKSRVSGGRRFAFLSKWNSTFSKLLIMIDFLEPAIEMVARAPKELWRPSLTSIQPHKNKSSSSIYIYYNILQKVEWIKFAVRMARLAYRYHEWKRSPSRQRQQENGPFLLPLGAYEPKPADGEDCRPTLDPWATGDPFNSDLPLSGKINRQDYSEEWEEVIVGKRTGAVLCGKRQGQKYQLFMNSNKDASSDKNSAELRQSLLYNEVSRPTKMTPGAALVIVGDTLQYLRPLIWIKVQHYLSGASPESKARSKQSRFISWVSCYAIDILSSSLSKSGLRRQLVENYTRAKQQNIPSTPPSVPSQALDELRRRKAKWWRHLLRSPVWEYATQPVLHLLIRRFLRHIPFLGSILSEHIFSWIIYHKSNHFMLERD